MLKLIMVSMAPGLASSALKRFTSLNLQAMVLTRIQHTDVKYWTEKYFSANDYIVDKGVSTFNGMFSEQSKDPKTLDKPEKKD